VISILWQIKNNRFHCQLTVHSLHLSLNPLIVSHYSVNWSIIYRTSQIFGISELMNRLSTACMRAISSLHYRLVGSEEPCQIMLERNDNHKESLMWTTTFLTGRNVSSMRFLNVLVRKSRCETRHVELFWSRGYPIVHFAHSSELCFSVYRMNNSGNGHESVIPIGLVDYPNSNPDVIFTYIYRCGAGHICRRGQTKESGRSKPGRMSETLHPLLLAPYCWISKIQKKSRWTLQWWLNHWISTGSTLSKAWPVPVICD
jgi:hypothetical protein